MGQQSILVVGAGRSSSALINYLLSQAATHEWTITVGDFSLQAAIDRVDGHSCGRAIAFDISKEEESRKEIAKVSVVVSLIPAHLHVLVARLCLLENKHLLTASYVSDEMKSLDAAAQQQGLLFLNECGLDPGIDHMSAMQVIDHIKQAGGKLLSFESFTGGLIAPTTDIENPWRYKFTWNPRNVVMAGQGTAKFLQGGQWKYISYQQLFKRTTSVSVPGYGEYEGYANRDSVKYLDTYGLRGIQTMLRGTLRNKGYCSAWNVLVQLGCCDDTYVLENLSHLSHSDFISLFLDDAEPAEDLICRLFAIDKNGEEMKRLLWSGFFSAEKIGLEQGTPAQVVEHILQKRWTLKRGDKDFIVMWHRFRYETPEQTKHEIQAYLTCTGQDETNTAMAQTVGLPLAIAAKLLLQGKIQTRGVVIPVVPELYNPILEELSKLNIKLHEVEQVV